MEGQLATADETVLVDCVRAVLERHGLREWQVAPQDFWCYVRPPGGTSRVQGWKLHLSATPLSAPLVLARAADVLARHRCHFKFAATLDQVGELVSRQCDRGSAGKFITAYPEGDDDELRALAAELDRATEGLPGPGVLSDRACRPGGVVHYRFGVFHGVPMLSNDGVYEAMLVNPEGLLVRDQRNAWFSPPPWAPRDPFRRDEPRPRAKPAAKPAAKPVLLNGRYVVRESIRQACTGGVYRATDRRTGAPVIVKQGRAHTQSTTTGQDIRDARRHEAEMLTAFASSGVTPRLVELFEQQGDLFLVQDTVPGVTLRRWVSDNTRFAPDGTWGPRQGAVERIALKLVGLVELVHDQGLVLRDLNPNNVMVGDDGDLRLIDLELLARPGQVTIRGYTPGYAAPEQVVARQIGPAPQPAVDLFSLGATLFHLFTGADPVMAADDPPARPPHERIRDWLVPVSAGNPAARRFGPIVVALTHEDPGQRPTLGEVRRFLSGEGRPPEAMPRTRDEESEDAALRRLLSDALDHLVATMDRGGKRLWPSGAFAATTDPCNVQHGAAGVLGALVLAMRTGDAPVPAVRDAVTTTARWISRRAAREPRVLPGLYFGRSGTAWALLEAGTALGDDELVRLAADLARAVPVRWPNPDVCHGAAGAGLTQLRFWEATGEQDFLERARQAADAVADAAAERRDGLVLWPVPADLDSRMAGEVHYGFAHGVAGAGAFLLAAGRATGEQGYLDLAGEAAHTLLSVARERDGAAYWTGGEKRGELRTNWCSGSSGVGTFLIRMWQANGDDRLRKLADQAAVAVHRSRWSAGTSQCHGLAGDGEFLLDLAEAAGEPRYRDWARDLAVGILVRHTLRDGRMLAPDETATAVTADFGTGLAGVLAFLLRLFQGTSRLWLPASLTESLTGGGSPSS